MVNPILVEITRGSFVESVHRGAVAIVDAKGRCVLSLGDVAQPVYPRSALKPIQAVPLLESGAADAFSLSDEEIALACASHSGEPMHITRIAAWLARIGCGVADIACGPHEVTDFATRAAMSKRGENPTPLHNNCSGKHTGFLTLARHLSAPTKGYAGIDHPVQRRVAATLSDMADVPGELPWGVDGCTVPNFAIPLAALARALARFSDPESLSAERADAVRRITQAMTAHPELVAGTRRICTDLMRQAPGHLLMKTGAEGVFAAVLLERGLAVALKIDDGAPRAAECAIAALLIALGVVNDDGAAHARAHSAVLNTRGAAVGERRATDALTRPTLKT